MDLLDLKSVRKFVKDIGGDVEKIDILINNAGMADGRKDKVRLETMEREGFKQTDLGSKAPSWSFKKKECTPYSPDNKV